MSKRTNIRETAAGMVDGVTLVIPCRGPEPLLVPTIRNALRTAGADIAIIVVWDGGEIERLPEADGLSEMMLPEDVTGTSAARHAGVMAAATTVVATCDAHMSFSSGWALRLLEYFAAAENAMTVACPTVYACDEEFRPMPGKSRAFYSGARIRWLDVAGGETRALVGQWAEHQPGAQIGCVMGAFYALRREWYHAIGQPWAVGTGWGCDEELISLASWMCGGECRLIPAINAYHVFERPRRMSVDDLAYVWLNRIRLVRLSRFSLADTLELLRAMFACEGAELFRDLLERLYAEDALRAECVRLQQRLAATDLQRWAWYRSTWITEDKVTSQPELSPSRKPELPIVLRHDPTRPQVIMVPAERCKMCGAINTFAKTDRDRTIPATESANKRQLCRCSQCGARAIRIFDGTLLQGREHVIEAMQSAGC